MESNVTVFPVKSVPQTRSLFILIDLAIGGILGGKKGGFGGKRRKSRGRGGSLSGTGKDLGRRQRGIDF